MYDDETFRFSLFDRLPDCRGDGGAIVEPSFAGTKSCPSLLFLWPGGLYSFSDSGYFRLT